jgi:hypothetical protein
MRIEQVEIYSDATNQAIVRHPDRKFPGVLFQGDTLYGLCQIADAACERLTRNNAAYDDVNQLRNALWTGLNHYKSVLAEHNIQLPFSEQPVR